MNDIFGILSSEDVEGLTALIEKLEHSSFDYLKLENDGLSITIGKNDCAAEPAASTVPEAAPVPVPAAVPAPTAAAAELPVPSAAEDKKAVSAPAAPGISYLKCPSYGLFYAQSEPGAPAYVKLGDHVAVGDTVGLLEIMKTYTAITADIPGTIAEILVNNQEAVEPDQPLFAIRAD